ncbi:MAG: hypothetical protein ACRCVN_04660 [Spirochaetia bacterium]
MLKATKRGLDHHLTQTLSQIIREKNIRCPSRIFKKEDLLQSLLKDQLLAIESNRLFSEEEKLDFILDLYKIRQVVDLDDHSQLNLQKTQNLPLFQEIFILWKKSKIKAKIISNEKKQFALFIDVGNASHNNEKAYGCLFSVEEGIFFDFSFSAGLKEEYRFSAQILEIIAIDREHFYLALAHTADVYAVFRHRYRQREVSIDDVLLESVHKIDVTGEFSQPLGEPITQAASIVSLTMAGCILRLKEACTEGLRVSIIFTVGKQQLLYYGRTGLPQIGETEEDEDQGEYLVEVQFTESTKAALCYLGEVVYEFRGSKSDAVIGYS